MQVRIINPEDPVGPIIELFRLSLGDAGGIPEEAFWRWKHYENPFGVSPTIGAFDGEKLVCLRTFLRWRFRRGSELTDAYRAVDTATHPAYRGKKLFTELTLRLVEQVKVGPPAFIFNTPNGQSKPGYLKMGWQQFGKTNVAVRVFPYYHLLSRLNRRPWPEISAPWSEDIASAWQTLAPFQSARFADVSVTDYSVAYFRWRYFCQPRMNYHFWIDKLPAPRALAFFRLKKSRGLRELRITDLFFTDPAAGVDALRAIARSYQPDVLTYLADEAGRIPVPFGYLLTRRGLNITIRELNNPAVSDLVMRQRKIYFSAGTLELF